MCSELAALRPPRSPVEEFLQKLHARHAGHRAGEVASYIPELARANPDWFGICIATRDGHVYEVGDTRQPFTIQSISKALTYGVALEDRGEDFILQRVGVEPSGDAFNAISLKPGSGAPFNPMINAGAIAICGQILPEPPQGRFEKILARLSAYAGRPLGVDERVYRSESETGHRNRAIGWMLRNFDILEEDPTSILEAYFRQCAIEVTCRDLAIMGATLANQGRNPLTREQAVDPAYVDNVLSVMSTCGMYDYSGEWLYRVGLPAKSGVGGGILAVLPGQLGIGIFSPPLDRQGNSARGIKVCEDLSRDLALHLFANGTAPQPALRLTYDGSQVSSCRRRGSLLQQALRGSGHRIRVMELQGELIFSTFEPVVRLAQRHAPYCQYLILNLRHVLYIDEVTLGLMADLRRNLAETGVLLYLCHTDRFARGLAHHGFERGALFENEDAVLERCENDLLNRVMGAAWSSKGEVPLAENFLLAEFDAADIAWLDERMGVHEAAAGQTLIQAGDPGDSLYLLISGSVEVLLPATGNGRGARIDIYDAGTSFGEMGLLDGLPRSADVLALEDVVCRVITRPLFDSLDEERPRLKIRLLKRLSFLLSYKLRKSNDEVAAYKG